MLGQRNWIFLLVMGAILLFIGAAGVRAGTGDPLPWLTYGGAMVVGSFILRHSNRRYVEEITRHAKEDLERERAELTEPNDGL
jgi:hypothetical protein